VDFEKWSVYRSIERTPEGKKHIDRQKERWIDRKIGRRKGR